METNKSAQKYKGGSLDPSPSHSRVTEQLHSSGSLDEQANIGEQHLLHQPAMVSFQN